MAVLDNETGVLSISGHIELSLLTPFQENPAVKSIVAEEGTVLPQDCSWLFCHFDEVTSIDLSHADTSNVKFMTGLFSEMVKLTSINLSGFDTSNVKVMREMFNACENLTELDLSTFDTSNVEDMMRMFSLNNKLKTVYVSDSWTMDKVENHELMFTFNFAITGGNGTVYDAEHTDGEYARIDSADAPGYFTRKETEPPTAEFDAETGILTLKGNVKAKDVKAYANNENVTGIVCAEGTVLPDNCSALLKDFNQVQSIDFSNADSSGVTNMSYMFENCEALTELDLSSFDTSKVKNTESMFSGDTLLKTVTVSDRWTMENVDVSTNMFGDNTALTGENGTAFTTDHTNYAYARIDTPKTPGYFTAKEEPAAVMTGDVNNDGSISSIDALLIYRYLNGWENVDLDTNAVDINGDGDFTISDAVIITRYINGWEGYDAYFSG